MKTAGIISFLIAVCALMGCNPNHDPRVETAYALAATDPTAALDSIAAIDTLRLSKSDRMLLRLTTIKATDKAYLDLPGDSVILPLVDYYSSHETDRFYPEALYYAGRIYSESGDSPNALRYFQDALDLLPENTPNKTLRGSVLSQTAAILANLRLFDQAEKYFNDALECDAYLKDTINMIYDIENLANIQRQKGNYSQALGLFLKSDSLSALTFPQNRPYSKSNLAFIYYKLGELQKAVKTLPNAQQSYNQVDLNTIYSNAATIYYRYGKIDSTFKYANKLISLKGAGSKRTGYFYLLRKEILPLIPKDSISSYTEHYLKYSNELLSSNRNQDALIQQSYYNYTSHERKRIKAEKEKGKMTMISLVLIVVICILSTVVLYYKVRNQRKKLMLNKALENIRDLRKKIAMMSPVDTQENRQVITREDDSPKYGLEDLRKELREKIVTAATLYENEPIPEQIHSSKDYIELTRRLRDKKKITDTKLWNGLKKTVNEAYPEFKHNLSILTEGEPRIEDLRTILLIKCGFTPSELGILLGLTKGAISSRRLEISKRLFGEKYSLKQINSAIRLL